MTSDHARKQAIRARMAATGEPYSVAACALDAGQPAAPDPAAAPAEALAELIACAGRTLTADSARIQVRADTDLGRNPEPAPRRPGPVGRLARGVGRRILGRVAPDLSAAEIREMFLHQLGAGFVEPAAGRYLIDYGGWAEMLVDGKRFSGASGQPLGPRFENRPGRPQRDDPLDALRRIERATAARWAGAEQVRRTTCRVVTATAGPSEFTVWLDGQRILRFQTVHRGSGRAGSATRTETVELWQFGVDVDNLDWTRLPSFRSPDDGGARRPRARSRPGDQGLALPD